MLVSAWNPSWSTRHLISFSENVANGKAALPPCHAFFQFYVADGKIGPVNYINRSADIFLVSDSTLPSLALFTLMMAQVADCNLANSFITFGDAAHLQQPFEQSALQLSRPSSALPKNVLKSNVKAFSNFKLKDLGCCEYDPHPHIKSS